SIGREPRRTHPSGKMDEPELEKNPPEDEENITILHRGDSMIQMKDRNGTDEKNTSNIKGSLLAKPRDSTGR
ncbi:hypothetical protein N9981_01350, partial [bacterium]|nr:hypothetical protein [bacterium]